MKHSRCVFFSFLGFGDELPNYSFMISFKKKSSILNARTFQIDEN